MGTAAGMEIEENLALAYRRGKKRTLKWGVTNEEREIYREELKILGLGLENRMNSKVGLLSGGQRQALTLLMATLQQPKLLFCVCTEEQSLQGWCSLDRLCRIVQDLR